MGITTHVLDTATGRPAINVPVRLDRQSPDDGLWQLVGSGRTDDEGRLRTLLPAETPAPPGVYRLTFDVASYFGDAAFFPEVQIVFAVRDTRHHHVPLLISPFGYSTYRGS